MELSLDYSMVDLVLVLEVGIERTATLLGGIGNIVHRRIGKTKTSKELPCYFDHQIFCLQDSRHASKSILYMEMDSTCL